MNKTKKRMPAKGTNKRINYITLYKRYGKDAVHEKIRELDKKYPLAFGKANPSRRVKILNQFLSKGDELNGKDT